jgi:hypothetical protein
MKTIKIAAATFSAIVGSLALLSVDDSREQNRNY